jgi:KDO2-lipid IV(A) lauroyltransferase
VKRALEYAAARVVLGTLRYGPFWLARLYARLLDSAIPRLRRTAYQNLAMALPEADARPVTDGVFRSVARLLWVFAKFPDINAGNVHRWIRYEGLDHLLGAQRRGRGVLIATGHLGNWEFSAFAHALMTGPMHVVARPLDNRRIDRLAEARRTASGNRVIHKKEAARAILQALKQGEAVGVLVDQNSSPEEGVFVPFFGVLACANAAFVRFAQHTGAAIVPGFALWSKSEQKYVLRFYPEIPVTGDVTADTAAVQRCLEEVIRSHPDQWLWIHRRWKTRPAGDALPAQLYRENRAADARPNA